MHDDRLDADVAQVDHVLGERALQFGVDHGVAAELDDDDLAGEALEPGQALDQRVRLELGVRRAGVEVLEVVAPVMSAYAEFSCT